MHWACAACTALSSADDATCAICDTARSPECLTSGTEEDLETMMALMAVKEAERVREEDSELRRALEVSEHFRETAHAEGSIPGARMRRAGDHSRTASRASASAVAGGGGARGPQGSAPSHVPAPVEMQPTIQRHLNQMYAVRHNVCNLLSEFRFDIEDHDLNLHTGPYEGFESMHELMEHVRSM